jgi:ribonuclease VapC
MFIDASALTAILAGEADASQLAGRMQHGRPLTISPLVVWETVVAVARIRGVQLAAARQVVFDYIRQAEIHG